MDVLVGGPDQVLHLIGQHLKVTFLALAAALASRCRPGSSSATCGKGETFAIALGNAGRARPRARPDRVRRGIHRGRA